MTLRQTLIDIARVATIQLLNQKRDTYNMNVCITDENQIIMCEKDIEIKNVTEHELKKLITKIEAFKL